MKPIVSIIIPCYNGTLYIKQTLDSILSQSFINFNVIIIDDGSTDDLKSILTQYKDERISYIYQNNKGVSTARNKGIELANGEYLIFFDADDLMTDDFISSRVTYLQQHSHINFVSGPVIKFRDNGERIHHFMGTGINGVSEILMFDQRIVTCPSNFMFKSNFIKKRGLFFHHELSSTADRFFLIRCHLAGNGMLENNLSALLYRISEKSMSNLLTSKLVDDNVRFYELLLENKLIPRSLKKQALLNGYYSIAASYFKINFYFMAIKFAVLAFSYDPVRFMRKTLKFIK